MTTELISLKLEKNFLKEIDKTAKENNYHNRTEFIRSALRKKIDDAKLKKAMQEIAHLKGASKKKTSDEQLEKIREKVYEELEKEDIFKKYGL